MLCDSGRGLDAEVVGKGTVAIKWKDTITKKGRGSALDGVKVDAEEGVVYLAELARLVVDAESRH
jgi:hypothetical protein